MPFDTRFCDGYLTIKPRKSQKNRSSLTPRSSASNIHHVQNIFHKTVEEGDMTQVKVLLRYAQNNIHLEEPNKHGRTAVQECCLKDNLEMIRLLLDHGASLESTDAYGWTALHYAAFFGSLSIVRFLVLSCADLMQANNNGEMAYDLAQSDEVKYYLQRMMMLRSDEEESTFASTDGDNYDDDDDDDYDARYYNSTEYCENSADKLSWKLESDNDSFISSIHCKRFDVQSDSRETIDTGESIESQTSSPSWDGAKTFLSSQPTFDCSDQNVSSSASITTNDDKEAQEEIESSLHPVEINHREEVTQYDEKCNAVASISATEELDEKFVYDRETLKQDASRGFERGSGIAIEREELSEMVAVRNARDSNICKTSTMSGDMVEERKKEEERKDEKKKEEENGNICKTSTMSGDIVEERKKEEERKDERKKDKKFKKTEIPRREIKEKTKDKVKSPESKSKVKSIQEKTDKNETITKEKKEVNEPGKDKKSKNKDKSRSKIPSAIPRFKKRIGGEKENSKKSPIISKGKGALFTANEGLIMSPKKEKANCIEERNRKGLEGLWERFRSLAARRNSNERDGNA